MATSHNTTIFQKLTNFWKPACDERGFYTNKSDVSKWLHRHDIKNFEIHDDLSVSVLGSVRLKDKNLTHLPVQFRKVGLYFDVSKNRLTSLVGSPTSVGTDFIACHNALTSLRGSPDTIKGWFDVSHNQIDSLEFFPSNTRFGVKIYGNNLENLEGLPHYFSGRFYCHDNPRLGDTRDKSISEIKEMCCVRDIQEEQNFLAQSIDILSTSQSVKKINKL